MCEATTKFEIFLNWFDTFFSLIDFPRDYICWTKQGKSSVIIEEAKNYIFALTRNSDYYIHYVQYLEEKKQNSLGYIFFMCAVK
jgi:hypothetical protein